jgi:glycosyltransferase involved in cell wall biosynthesis
MNILQVVHQFLPNLAGTEIHTFNLAQSLATRHNMLVYYRDHACQTPGFHGVDDVAEGLDVRRVSLNLTGLRSNPYRQFISPYLNPEIERDFACTLARFRPDIVHFQHLAYLSAGLPDIVRRQNIPVVMTLHDFWFKCSKILLLRYTGEICRDNEGFQACADCVSRRRRREPARGLMALILKRRDQLLRRALRQAQVVIAPSRFLKEQYVSDGYLPASSVQVIEHGIDTAAVLPHRPRDGRQPVRFAYIGGIAAHKGVHVLVEAFNRVHGQATLDIYGNPQVYPAYTAELQQKIKHPSIRLQGNLARQDLWRTLSGIDVVVVPSLWYETLSLIVSEAFAAGVPVIASRLGSLADRVDDGVTGFLFPPGDSLALAELLQQLVDDPARLAGMQQQIGPVVSAAENVCRVEEVYSGLL